MAGTASRFENQPGQTVGQADRATIPPAYGCELQVRGDYQKRHGRGQEAVSRMPSPCRRLGVRPGQHQPQLQEIGRKIECSGMFNRTLLREGSDDLTVTSIRCWAGLLFCWWQPQPTKAAGSTGSTRVIWRWCWSVKSRKSPPARPCNCSMRRINSWLSCLRKQQLPIRRGMVTAGSTIWRVAGLCTSTWQFSTMRWYRYRLR